MVGIIFIHIPQIVDGTTLHLHSHFLLPFYYTSQPSCNLAKALYNTTEISCVLAFVSGINLVLA